MHYTTTFVNTLKTDGVRSATIMVKPLQQADLKQQLSNVAKKHSFLGTVPPALRLLPLAAFAVTEYIENRYALSRGGTSSVLLEAARPTADTVRVTGPHPPVVKSASGTSLQKTRHPLRAVHHVDGLQCCLMSRLAGVSDQTLDIWEVSSSLEPCVVTGTAIRKRTSPGLIDNGARMPLSYRVYGTATGLV